MPQPEFIHAIWEERHFFPLMLAAIWASFGARDTWETVNSIIICLPSYPGGLTSSRAASVLVCVPAFGPAPLLP